MQFKSLTCFANLIQFDLVFLLSLSTPLCQGEASLSARFSVSCFANLIQFDLVFLLSLSTPLFQGEPSLSAQFSVYILFVCRLCYQGPFIQLYKSFCGCFFLHRTHCVNVCVKKENIYVKIIKRILHFLINNTNGITHFRDICQTYHNS